MSPEIPRPSRRGFLRACATAAVLLTGGLAGSAAFAGTATASTDVVDAARAALPDRGGITHYRMSVDYRVPTAGSVPSTSGLFGAGLPQPFDRTTEDEAVFTGLIERWTATEPLRDRSAWHYNVPGGGTGTVEESHGDSAFRLWVSWSGEAPTEVRLTDEQWEDHVNQQLGRQRVWFHNAAWTADPIGGIRTMLDNDMLRSAGRITFEGRSVLRLVGEEAGTAQNGSPGGPVLHEYLVDPTSFAPVRVASLYTVRPPGQNGEPGERYRSTATFFTFEHLPLNDSTRHLLVAGAGH